jgi:hypothetical protein
MKYISLSIYMAMAGCTQPQPSIRITQADGRLIEVAGVPGATEAAMATISSDGAVVVSTGAGQGLDQALDALSTATSWPAMALILFGLAILCLSFKFPMLPRSTSMILIAAGIGLLAFPILLDRYSIFVFMGLALVAGLFLFGMWDNRRKIQAKPPKRK